jgi:hypothetical protein
MRRQSEASLLFVLLPIFCLGVFPMLLMLFLGFVGLGMLGVLFICVALADALRANSDFHRDVIVGGYMPPSDRAFHRSDMRSTGRLAAAIGVAGGGLIATALIGILCFS